MRGWRPSLFADKPQTHTYTWKNRINNNIKIFKLCFCARSRDRDKRIWMRWKFVKPKHDTIYDFRDLRQCTLLFVMLKFIICVKSRHNKTYTRHTHNIQLFSSIFDRATYIKTGFGRPLWHNFIHIAAGRSDRDADCLAGFD